MKTLEETLDSVVIKRPRRRTFYHPQHICLDKGYDYPEIEKAVIKRKYIPHIRHRGRREPERYCEMPSTEKVGRRKKCVMDQPIQKTPCKI
jgi:hypothetical protein